MLTYQVDPDIERWGLHHLLDGCSIVNSSSHGSITQYNADFSEVVPVKEDYVQEKDNVENDEIIARALQEELSRVAEAEASGILDDQVGQSSILSQDWCGSSQRHLSYDHSNIHDGPDGKAEPTLCAGHEETSPNTEDLAQLEISDEYILDSELGRRLDQMIPIPHVPKVNGDMPTADEATSDHQRLLDRLKLYELAELRVQGDGNCQFRALSDQFYRSPEHHKIVRQQVVHQLKSHPELYEGYVPMNYGDYLKKISRTGEWGDHVTLQACADSVYSADPCFFISSLCILMRRSSPLTHPCFNAGSLQIDWAGLFVSFFVFFFHNFFHIYCSMVSRFLCSLLSRKLVTLRSFHTLKSQKESFFLASGQRFTTTLYTLKENILY